MILKIIFIYDDYILINFFAENNIIVRCQLNFLNFIISKKLYKNNLYLKNNISLFLNCISQKIFLFKENISAFAVIKIL